MARKHTSHRPRGGRRSKRSKSLTNTIILVGGLVAASVILVVALFLTLRKSPSGPNDPGLAQVPQQQKFSYIGPDGPTDLPKPIQKALDSQPTGPLSPMPGLKDRAKPSAKSGYFDVTDQECQFSVTLPGDPYPVRRTHNGTELERAVSGAWLGSVNNNAIAVTVSARRLSGDDSRTTEADVERALRQEERILDPAAGHKEIRNSIVLDGHSGIELRTSVVIPGRPTQQHLYAGIIVDNRLYSIKYVSRDAISNDILEVVYASFRLIPK